MRPIAKNERHNIQPCFETFWDFVDEVVLADTGSTDGTIPEARRFARSRGEANKLVISRHLRSESETAVRLAQMRLMDETVTQMVASLSPSNLISMATDTFGARR